MKILTNHPIALDSNDHLVPHGARADNTRCPAFVKACERLMPGRKLRVLDLGCAGGGLVEDFLEAGHDAYGIDGAEAAKREAWLRHPERFFMADISRLICHGGGPPVDIVAAFEVLEHIRASDLMMVMSNLSEFMCDSALFIATISLVPDEVNGVQYHQTVRPADWWRGVLEGNGFTLLDDPFTEDEWPRKEKTSLRVVARRAV